MGLSGALGFSLALVSLTQILHSADAEGCKILSAKSSGPSSILVKWEKYTGATNYFLDVRVKNNTNIAPIVVTLSGASTEKDVRGLRPGTEYSVTLKVFEFYYVVCVTTAVALTVPAASQIVAGQALSSTSVTLEWTEVPSAEHYLLMIKSVDTGQTVNKTYTNTSALLVDLDPSTNYEYYIYTFNQAGFGRTSKVRTVTTLDPPPVEVTVTQIARGTARITWTPVEGVLLYKVVIRDLDEPTIPLFMYNISDTMMEFGGILPCSTYLISVSSFNKFLMPSESTDRTYTTNKLRPVSSVSVDYTCATQSAMVYWSSVFGADSYSAVATGDNGTRLMCTSKSTGCQITGLRCGQSYVVRVTPISENCNHTMNATSATFQTVPCPPTNLNLLRECSSEVIIFSWEQTNNTDHYMAKAVDSQGVVQECLTDENSCYFTHTVCGRHYTFTVYSIAGQCRSQVSSTVDIRTAPCIPQNLQTSADCSSDVLTSKWDLAEGAQYYTVEAFGNRGNSHYNCSSMSNSCAIEGVHCGEYLTIYITAFDEECASPRTLGPVAETVPCVPQNVSAVKECGADSITVTWLMSGSAIFYIAIANDSNGNIHSCKSTDLICTIVGLKCSTIYTAYTIASNFMCNSSDSEMVTIETGACPPDHLAASLDCAANEALISWRGQPEINSFTATLVDEDLVLLSCSSTNWSCKVPNLKCDQLYTVIVSHHDGMCPSLPSEPIYMQSVPCGPHVDTNLDCQSQALTLSWNAMSNTDGYEVVTSYGNSNMSYITTEPGLTITTLECGLDYMLKVTSFNSTCVSRPSVLSIRETPCVPTDVTATGYCGESYVQVTWDASRGAQRYQAAAVDEAGQRLLCSSNGTSCMMEDLMCSQVYSVWVTAMDDTCTSNRSSVDTLPTAPCPPSGFTAWVNCTSNSAVLAWLNSPNAVSYTGKAVSADGQIMTCDAGMNLGCLMEGLSCGEEYTFTVSASDGQCESPDSEAVIHLTAPCAVESVLNTLNCITNTLTISWAPGSMALNYSATALAGDGTALRCLTEESSCTMTDLQCGQRYTVTVKAISSTCEGHNSVPEIVNSVPCVPMNVRGDMVCSNNTLEASWDAAPGAVSYNSTLSGEGGFSSSCPTSDVNCIFPHLQCAQTYTFSLVAVNDRCNSSESAVISARTAPCDPTNVNANLSCLSGVATVTWGASAGALHYTVVAEANEYVDSCNSTGTSCELTGLQCGENYTVTVLAGDGKCNSSILAKTSVMTAPCAPVIEDHSLDCVSNHATVTLVEDEDAVSIMVNATSNLRHQTSCSSSNSSSCVLNELQCGHNYTVYAVAQGVKCLSKPSTSFQIVTAPCTPTNVEKQTFCGNDITLLNWDETLGRKRFFVSITSGDQMTSFYRTDTFYSTTLQCGHLYDVKVFAVADHCNSSTPGQTTIQTDPCAPKNISTSLVCDNNTADVRWQHSPGAVSYKVKALGRYGDYKECITNSTRCLLPNMKCAQTYSVTVTPFSVNCEGSQSYEHNFVPGPCPPTNVTVSLQCVGNVGVVNWTAAPRADVYIVTALPSAGDGHNYTCTSNGTNCSLPDLHCGETYIVTVVTMERGCTSEPSTPYTFQSVICPPTGVTGVTTCSNNDITVSWNPSPETGVDYILHSQEDGGASANFSTAQWNHVLTGLQCGELYTLSVAARDNKCTSILSNSIQKETAPCPPTSLTARADCGTNLGTLTWAPSVHAISYTATFTGTHGHVVSCSSKTTTCSVKLDCGHQYSAVVVASSATCNSSIGTPLTFDSAPCLPDRVAADLDCTANSFAVQWRGSIGDVSYTAIAIGSDGTRATCNSTSTNCNILNLKCGLNYSIVVTTSSVDCGVIDGSDYMIQSAPCKPDMASAVLNCSTNTATVTWGNSGPDQIEVVSAVDSRGMTTTCNSSSSNCTFNQLTCGESYTISVVGHTNKCSSEAAVVDRLNTAPCVPTHLTRGPVDCLTGIVMLTWDSAPGATSYTISAEGNLGHNDEENVFDTNYAFQNLACGQDYNITVVAHHDSCSSPVSQSISASTGPCPHSRLQANLDCQTNTAVVSWTPGSGIRYYNATATPSDITHQQACSTNGSSCNISSLSCGETYMVRVSGQGLNCPSPALDWSRINSAPCPPTQLMVDSSCESNNITVRWQTSQGSVSYMAVAEDAQGRRKSCNTSSTTCQISGLLCGQQYHVYVAGVNEDGCIGAESDFKVIHTAPCVAQNITTELDCLSAVLNVTWQSMGAVSQFRASVVSSKGQVSICQTDKHHCVVRNMQCGLIYNVTVVAQDDACNSSHSLTKQVLTAPCPLATFLPVVNCTTGIVSITWNNSVEGVTHTVSAVDATGRQHNCSGTNSGCDLSMLECGTEYNVTITPSRDACVGRNSTTQMIKTVPCVPHVSDVEIDCLTNSAWVMYEDSAGAEEYVVMVTDSQGDVKTFECNISSNGTCSLPPLMCSQNLTFTLRAHNQQCPSAPSNAVTTETAPCAPENIEESVGCDNRTVSIGWSAVPGAVTYTATLEQITGGTYCCNTSGTSCDIGDLPCGEMYILLVMAEGRTCNSSQSEGNIVRTVPCDPQNLEANLSCSDNVAAMSWEHSRGGQLYRVRAVGTDGHVDMCSSHENHCSLTGLHCGQFYTATVMAEDRDCKSNRSNSVTFKTVPCTPANISSVVDCEDSTLIASWSESLGADSYIATVQSSSGQTTTCLGTTEGSCNVTGVGCGQIYRVSVVSSDGYCDSPATPEIETHSVPCKPRLIKAVMDCYSQTAAVSWYPSDGALSYMVIATTALGHRVTCETNDTNCDLDGLLCGQNYSVSVKAVGWSCCSFANMTGWLVTEPCIPEHITTTYSMTIGQVLWDPTPGAQSYVVEGVTEQGLVVSCGPTIDTYCPLENMGCGEAYTINVTANNHVCQDVSTSTQSVVIMTEPCPPSNVQARVQCDNDMGLVSWETSYGAVGYEARVNGRNGHSLSCYSTDTFCYVEGLHCGIIYYTSVIAVGEKHNSSSSTTVLLASAPCPAGNVAAHMDCYNNTANVSWSLGDGGLSYMVTAVGQYGHRASCETDEHQCELTELQCGETYNVSLTTISDDCQIEMLTNVTFSTRPCKPLRVGVDLQCGMSTAIMYWEESEGVELYMATANSSTGMSLHCNSTNSTCQFSNLHCGETYRFSVTAYSDMCCSEMSNTVEIQTGPCQPTGLTVSGTCNNDTVELVWSAAEGASVYVVTATGDLGYITAFQTNETMIEADLLCGQLYTFTVKSQDDRCDSAWSMSEEFKTGPCVPQNVESFTQCVDSVGSARWAESDGAESYLAIAVGLDGHTHMCTTNTTNCTWDDLHCGEQYEVHVIANDYLCSSLPSDSTFIRMAPCIPQNLQSSLNCTMKVGTLTWNASETAKSYIVTAKSGSGHKIGVSTNETWTFISEFNCGEEYDLTVQSVDDVCTSLPSQPSKLQSEPCPPTNVSSFMNCVSNIAVVSWTSLPGADFYTATLTQEDGQSQSCWSDGMQCGMPNVICGQNYTVTVVASNEMCNSDPSEADSLQSVPCVPTDVDVTMDCANNQALISWNASMGALSYKVTAKSTHGEVSSCESANVMCTLTNLTCGQSYVVQVVAQDDICSSLPSPVTNFNSVPCTPDIGSVVLDCFTNSALLDWSYSKGAMNYTATARSSSGNVSTCNTNSTNCELMHLQCGQIYNVTTVAANRECSSPPSTQLQVESVPCPPEDIVPVVNCSTNTIHVGWQPSRGAISYIVQAFGVEEHESGCETDSWSCVLPDLLCGFTYNVSVTAVNSVCNISQSKITQVQSVPCVPQHVEARVVCKSGAVAVSWEPSKGALSYTTVAQGSGGFTSVCTSNDTTCLLDDLLCSHNYSITVSASDKTCSSAESFAAELSTAPCVPQNVMAEMVCSNDTGIVWWEEDEGVSSYVVRAFGPDGHRTQCNTTATSCQLPSMHCGQLYNLTVTAQDGECDNSHADLTLQSVPCRPTNVKAALRCHSKTVAVTWEPASGALSYLAVAVSADGSHKTECNNTMTFCDLSNLQCGQTYNVSVFGRDESCSSVESDKAYVRTAPCTPQNVTVDAHCGDEAMTVSWSPNPDAQYFYVMAVSNTGARLHCNSSTACTLTDLPCGQTYNVTVQSVREDCESQPSAVVETSSAPCVPSNAKSRPDCVTNDAWVTWDPSAGALSYHVLAQGVGGHNASCTAPSSPCNVADLKCGTLYTIHVTASNKYCHSNHSTTFEHETGPCALTSINAVTQCNSNKILVEWELMDDTPLYLVTAEGRNQTLIYCNSSSDSCELEGIECDTNYSIIVSASSDKCSSLRSPPKKIKTAPCAPGSVTVVASCEVNGATVTWTDSPMATSYLLTASGRDGHVVHCNTTVNNCTLSNLHCGQPYDLTITARGENCTSPPSISTFRTVPCEPSGLEVDVDCETNSAVLFWDPSEGAVEYYGCAQSMDGDMLYCDTPATSCAIDGLECGKIYNFSVEASDGTCNSSFSPPLQAGAVPCAPTNLKVRMQRIERAHWAMLSWNSVSCPDVEYLVEINGRIQGSARALMNVSSYWLPRPYFEFPMPCSTEYNITERSRNSAGVSEPSSALTGVTVPCAPQNVEYTGDTDSAVLSWDASVFATGYSVYNVSGTGRVALCSTTTELTCQLTNFDPNAIEVTASNEAGESIPNGEITGPAGARRRRDLRVSEAYGRYTGLEIPKVLTVKVSGLSLYVEWTRVMGATEYTVVIQEKHKPNHPPRVRTVEGHFYKETDLKPWTTYCIRLAAKNTIDQSNYTREKCRTTGAS